MNVLRPCPKTILDYMKRHDLSQAAFGKRISASQAAVSLWITGKGTMSIKSASRIERRTNGEIRRKDLLPKLFQEVG